MKAWALALVVGMIGVGNAAAQDCYETAQVVGLNAEAGGLLNVRTGPGREFSAAAQIRLGDVVQACGFSDEWTQIVYANGAEGWVSGRFLAPIDESAEPTITASATAVSAPTASGGFRPSETVNAVAPTSYSPGYTSWSGSSDGVFYRYYGDGSGSVGNGPGVLDPKLWSISCKTDAMTDEKSCSVHDDGGSLFLLMRSKQHIGVCAMGHDYPGRNAMIRIDRGSPIDLGVSGCESSGTLAQTILSASDVTVRSYDWPYDYSRDKNTNLAGFPLAIELARYLWDRDG